jgi:hypothetical protein
VSFAGLEVRLAAAGEVSWFNALLAAHHHLGPRGSARLLRYLAVLDGQPAVLATFGAAVRRCRPREEFVGWDDEQRAARLPAVAGNQRLCVLPGGRRPSLASAALAGMLRRLPADHLAAYGQPLVAVETFTDPARGPGTVYAAAGFTPLGLTAGYSRARGRSDYVFHGAAKQYWLRGLGGTAATAVPGLLSSAFDSPLITPGRKGRPNLNTLAIGGGRDDGSRSLLEHLAEVSDHRKARGIRHPLAAILVVIAVAKLCGADSLHAIGQFAATMPQQALARCGCRRSPRTGRYRPPGLKTIKRAVRAIDAGQADAAVCAWLRQESAAGRLTVRHYAIDGKTIKGARDAAGHAPHLLAAYDLTDGSVAAQLDVEAKHNEITYFADLLASLPATTSREDEDDPGGGGGDDDDDDEEEEEEEEEEPITLVTADALHTQTAHVEAMNKAGIDWMLIAKGSQPGLEEQICSHDWESFPPSARH